MLTVQIAVRLPAELLKAVDRLVAEGLVESRSDAVRQGLDELIDTVERARIDQTLLAGYRRVPPTSDEEAAALLALRAAITEEPW